MDRLGLVRPDISPRASGHIVEQIGIVNKLIGKGYAYEVDGNVYFDVHKFSGYGKLSGRKVEELEAGARVEVKEDKKHPADFALWKKAGPEHLMQWESPWGSGYPGWHLECSCMSTKYLGETFDIHGGGLENIFPHHECEIAQSEAAFEKPFARYWLHNNMVTVDGVKMGKSLNNFITIKEALKKYDPIAIRYFVLMSHYRSALDFSDAALEAAQRGLKKLQTTWERLSSGPMSVGDINGSSELTAALEDYDRDFHAALNDDFNPPKAIAALFDLFGSVNNALDNKTADREQLAAIKHLIDRTAGGVLGILGGTEDQAAGQAHDIGGVVEVLLEIRNELRRAKNFTLSDKIRDGLQQQGIVIKDTPDGTTWGWE
jgi:cysteinyl-tRNA synthetase